VNDTPLIIILGQVPPDDLQKITGAAKALSFAVECIAALDGRDLTATPGGYISYLDPIRDALLHAFAVLPCASRDEIPFFQYIPSSGVPDFFKDLPITGVFGKPLNESEVWNMLQCMKTLREVGNKHNELIGEIIKYRRQKQQLIAIGTSLSLQDDLYKLLDTILSQTREILYADAACIYLRERKGVTRDFADTLRFKVMQND
jgi:hypothetical protein